MKANSPTLTEKGSQLMMGGLIPIAEAEAFSLMGGRATLVVSLGLKKTVFFEGCNNALRIAKKTVIGREHR